MLRLGLLKAFHYTKPLVEGEYAVLPHHPIPPNVPKPFYYWSKGKSNYSGAFQGLPQVQTKDDILRLRKAGRLAADTLQKALDSVRVGMTTEELDKIVHDFILSRGGYPAPVYYMTFPKSVCTSVNEGIIHLVVCHGIPNTRPLQDGDIVNIDVTVYIDDVYGDNSDMAVVGTPHADVSRLVAATREALRAGISVCAPGNRVREIGAACHAVATKHGFGVCEEFAGHGIGRQMHMPPAVVHVPNNIEYLMVPGMVFTIEPILILSPQYELEMWKDNWTVVDKHKSPSAQCEHMVLITESGCEILTER